MARRHPILARVGARGPSAGEADDRLGTAEGSRVVGDLMTKGRELFAHLSTDGRLERDVAAGEVPEAWRIDRLLNVHLEDQEVEQDLHVALRLHGTAHHAVAHKRLFDAIHRLRDERGNDRVQRSLARRDHVDMPFREYETRAAI